MALAPGTRLGPYEIGSPLGSGGMGEVYRAKDTRLDRTVAIKIFSKDMSADLARKQRFEREAKTISGLNHPNICVLHDVGSQDGIDYLVMECLEGETLAKRLDKGPLPLDQVLKLGSQIADALDRAHRSGVVHRDLKPGNIMLAATGAKLLDFGLAKPTAVSSSLVTVTAAALVQSPVTQEGTIIGTFQYMSPEQIEGKEVDARSDIFSLGTVLYEALTGKKAFEGKSQLSVAGAILEKEPEPISAIKPMTPASLDRTIRKCLAKNPDDRWQSASDLATQLNWVAEGTGSAPTPHAVTRGWLFRNLGWLVSAALLASILAGAAWWSRSREPKRTTYYASPFHLNVNDLALSPDGRMAAVVAYWEQANKYVIWTYRLGDPNPKVLEGTEGAAHPFWSPDGTWIAFFAQGKLKKVVVEGKSVQTLCDAPNGRGGAWNKGGVILFTPDVFTGLYRVSASGGVPSEETTLDTARMESSHRWPVFLPDGKHYLYLGASFSGKKGVDAIYVGSLDSKGRRLIVPASSNAVYAKPGYLLYEKEGSLVAQAFDLQSLTVKGEPRLLLPEVRYWSVVDLALFDVAGDGTILTQLGGELAESRLSWYDRSGKLLGSVGPLGSYSNPSISPDGTRIAYDQRRVDGGQSGIWIRDLKTDALSELTLDPSLNQMPVWSPDGKKILFTSNRTLFNRVFEKNADGSGQEVQVVDLDVRRQVNPWDWSRDGKYVLVRNQDELWYYSPSEEKSHPYIQEKWVVRNAQFSPDGKFVAYTTNESGRWEVYVSPFPNATSKWKVSHDGGEEPRWSPDGTELYFLTPEGRLMVSRVNTRSSFETMSPAPLFQARGRQKISSQDVCTYAVAGKDKFLFNTVAEQKEAPPLSIVMNWSTDLQK